MLIGEVKKGTTKLIRISNEEFMDHRFCDVRIYYKDHNGEWRPTKKGITLHLEDIEGVIDALKNAGKELSIQKE